MPWRFVAEMFADVFLSGRLEAEIGADWDPKRDRRRRAAALRAAERLAGSESAEALAEAARSAAKEARGIGGPGGEDAADELESIARWALRDLAGRIPARGGWGDRWIGAAKRRLRLSGERMWDRLEGEIREEARLLREGFGFSAAEISGLSGLSARKALRGLRKARAAARIAAGKLGIDPRALGGFGRCRIRLESRRMAARSGALGFFEPFGAGEEIGRIRLDASGKGAGWTLAHEWAHMMDRTLGKRALELGGEEGRDLFTCLPLAARRRIPAAQEGFSKAYGALHGIGGESAEMRMSLEAVRLDRGIGKKAAELAVGERPPRGPRGERAIKAMARWARAAAGERRAGRGEEEERRKRLEEAEAEALEALRRAFPGKGLGKEDLGKAAWAAEMAAMRWGPTGLPAGSGLFSEESLRGCWALRTGYWAMPSEMIARAAAARERERPWRHALLAGAPGEFWPNLRGKRASAPLLGKEQARLFAEGISEMSQAAGLGTARIRASESEEAAGRLLEATAAAAAKARRWWSRRSAPAKPGGENSAGGDGGNGV